MASGSGWNLWVWVLGVVVRRYIHFLILLIRTPLVSVLFYSSIPTFFLFFFMFIVLYIYTVNPVIYTVILFMRIMRVVVRAYK